MTDETFGPAAGYSPAAVAAIAAAPAPALRRFTLPELRAHLTQPFHWLKLPDGTALSVSPSDPAGPGLRASGKDIFERLAGMPMPVRPLECRLLLWCATRTAAELRALWKPAAPVTPGSPVEVPADHLLFDLRETALAWADAVFPPGADDEICTLAWRLWDHEHATMLHPDRAGLEDDALSADEKKSLYHTLRGSLGRLSQCQERISRSGIASSSEPPSEPSSPPTAPGSTTKPDGMSSPPKPMPRVTGKSKRY